MAISRQACRCQRYCDSAGAHDLTQACRYRSGQLTPMCLVAGPFAAVRVMVCLASDHECTRCARRDSHRRNELVRTLSPITTPLIHAHRCPPVVTSCVIRCGTGFLTSQHKAVTNSKGIGDLRADHRCRSALSSLRRLWLLER